MSRTTKDATDQTPTGPDTFDDGAANRVTRRAFNVSAAALGAGAAIAGVASAGAAPASRGRLVLSRAQADQAALVIGMDGSPSDLDPHSAYDYRSVLANNGTYEGLIGLKDDRTDEFEGLIAESWTTNQDQSVWTFTLREGVTFQDGTPCDANAVLLNYERLFTLGLGAVGVLTRFITDWKTQITAPDAKTIIFDCGRPQPLLGTALASQYAMPIVNAAKMKEHEVDGDWGHVWAQTNAEGTGTGPYKIVNFEPGTILEMERNETYWGGWEGTHFERIVLRPVTEVATRRQLLEQGEVDIVDSLTAEDVAALRANPDIVVLSNTSTQVIYFTMTVSGPLASPEARQAMCYAFPYQEVIEGVYKDTATYARGAVAEAIRGFDPNTFQYTKDIAKAKELFAAAGVAEGTELTVTFETGNAPVTTSAQLFQASLAECGITLTIDQVDLPTFTSLFYGDAPAEERPNLFWWGWWPDYNDAWNHLYPQVSSEAWGSKGANAGFYSNTRVDELLAVARDAPDDETYLTAISEIQQIVSRDDPPSVYYAQPKWTTLYRKDLQGVVFNPINIGVYNFWKMSRQG
jgi:peptide/nickel transport system substrate-binding protein